MSKSIYLSKLKIKNFRTYGCDVELDLPAEPGLLIVCGMNGLGKTAFFDAMEWALTGDVQRLHEKLGKSCEKELTRDGVTPGMHGVELFFSEGNPIARGPNASCDKTSIINLLKHPEWEPEIRDIRPYLRLTHFLPQSSMQRFLEKDEGDQWKRLEGPAGVERLERLRKLLNDPKARNAFTRRIDTLTREWMDAQKSLKEWEQRVVAWQDLRSMASANDAISPAQLDAAINAIWNRIADADVGNPPPLLTASTPVEKLGALKTLIEKQLLVAQDLGRKIPVAEQTLMDWNSLNSRKGAEKAKREAAQKAIPAREWAIAEALGPIEAIRNTVHRFEKEKSEAEETAGLLLQIINNLERTGELETTLRLTAGKIEALTVETSTKQTERDNIEKLRRQREDAIQKQIRVRKTQMAFEAAAQRYAELTETIKAAEFAANNRAKLLSSQADVAQRKEKAEAERRRLEEYIQDVRNHLAAEKLAADAIGRAVVEIAQRLTEHDTICPVCSHSHGPGELLEEARKSMARARTGSDTQH
jgi:exonuclease SbcC